MQSYVPGLYVFSYVSAALQDQFKKPNYKYGKTAIEWQCPR
jgi:hypothetical protein